MVDELATLRARMTALAARYPLGTRVGSPADFLAEFERGQALRDEAEQLLRKH